MDESVWNAIYDHLFWKDTDELIGYWQRHDEEEWTAGAFEVMEKILIERLGKLPSKDEIDELLMTMDAMEEKSNPFTELKTLINDNDPVFYEPNKVTLLIKWIFRSLNLLIILYILQFVFDNFRLFRGVFDGNFEIFSIVFGIIFNLGNLLITIVAIFILYKALGYVLKILKEMEVNSRNQRVG